MKTTTADGVTYDQHNPYDKPIGSDGKAYDSVSAATRASKLYNKTAQDASRSSKLGLRSQELDVQSKEQALKNKADTAALTKEFLSKWGDINTQALTTLQNAISGGTSIGNAEDNSLIQAVKNQIQTFDEQYGGIQTEALQTSLDDIKARQDITNELRGLAEPDYEGVTGRAATDVSTQSALAREASARELMSSGVDPTSGKFGALQEKSYLGEARNKVEAMNKARRSEKERATGLKMDVLDKIDPSASADIAKMLMSQKSDLLGLQTQAYNAATSADTSKANLANVMSDIASQYGSLGSTMLGLNTAS